MDTGSLENAALSSPRGQRLAEGEQQSQRPYTSNHMPSAFALVWPHSLGLYPTLGTPFSSSS